MATADLVVIAVAGMTWLWSLPVRGQTPQLRRESASIAEVEWLTRLQAQLVVSSDFESAVRALEEPPARLSGRIERLTAISAEAGISCVGPVGLLLIESRSKEQARRRWREQTSGAQASSLLLALLPAVMWLTGGTMGMSPLAWLFGTPFGLISLTAFAFLTLASRWWLRSLQSRALAPPTAARARGELPASLAAASAALAVFAFRPDGLGAVAAAVAASVVAGLWSGLEPQSGRLLQAAALAERPWLTALLAAALATGLDWRRSVSLLAAEAVVDAEVLGAVDRRLRWGIEPAAAFSQAGHRWQELAMAIAQTEAMGAPVANGLTSLSEHWQRDLGALELERVERVAARSVLPVSLLQLPAFIIAGLVPVLAVSMQPLLDLWLSTSA